MSGQNYFWVTQDVGGRFAISRPLRDYVYYVPTHNEGVDGRLKEIPDWKEESLRSSLQKVSAF